jgi:hypothetical protein
MRFLEQWAQSGASRRHFLRAAGASGLILTPSSRAADARPNVLGPRDGYSPHLGTLVSEMTWMRGAVLRASKGMTQPQLDFLLDNKANRIGALLLHLAATEKLFQLATFDGVKADDLEKTPAFKDWSVPMNLGGPGREAIKGHDLDYYLKLLKEGREKTLAEFRKRDDKWLLTVDESWPWGPTDNLCKWFHVCEHESHHTGQISLLKSRVPGMTAENG